MGGTMIKGPNPFHAKPPSSSPVRPLPRKTPAAFVALAIVALVAIAGVAFASDVRGGLDELAYMMNRASHEWLEDKEPSAARHGEDGDAAGEREAFEEPSEERPARIDFASFEEAAEFYECPYAITGTVVSPLDDDGFSFRVDEPDGALEPGTEIRVETNGVEARLYGMKGLQWGMDGVVIAFKDMPGEDGLLHAIVIQGNDDTSSAYWENMEIVY